MPVDHPRVGRPVEESKFDNFFQKLVPVRGMASQCQKKAGLDESFRLSAGAVAAVSVTIFILAHK
jgi:hypothetical protein